MGTSNLYALPRLHWMDTPGPGVFRSDRRRRISPHVPAGDLTSAAAAVVVVSAALVL